MTKTTSRELLIERETTSQKLGEVSDQGLFRVAIITPGMGSSGFYSKEVLQEAVERGVFAQHTHSYVDHPTLDEQWNRPERSIRDLMGVLESEGVWEEDGAEGPGVYADVKTFSNYTSMIKEMAPYIGMSIRAWCEGEWEETDGGVFFNITKFDMLESVDAVTHAGRGGAFVKMLESARQKPVSASARKVAGSLPLAKESVSSGATDHTKGKTVDEETKNAFAAMKTQIEAMPALIAAAVGSAVGEAMKPADPDPDTKTPVEVAQELTATLAESGIPVVHHAKFYDLVKTGMTKEAAVTFLTDLVGKEAPATSAREAAVGQLFSRQGTASFGRPAAAPAAGSAPTGIESLAARTRREMGVNASKGA